MPDLGTRLVADGAVPSGPALAASPRVLTHRTVRTVVATKLAVRSETSRHAF